MRCLNYWDFRALAKRRLPRGLFEYIDRGTEDEHALRALRSDLDALRLVPRALPGVAARALATSVLGRQLAMPVVTAPTALAGLVSHGGEIQLARAARRHGIPMCVSTYSVTAIEEIRAGAAEAELWFQLYVWKNRALTRQLVDAAHRCAVSVLVVTIDSIAPAKREYNTRNGFEIPFRLSARAAADLARHPGWLLRVALPYLMNGGLPSYAHYPPAFRRAVTARSAADDVTPDSALSWADIREIRRWWPHKLLIKGILHPEDAKAALDCGADGVVVSSHGARNVDVAPSPIEVLPAIAEAVGGRTEILADSGIRRGGDVVKYLAAGASAVMVGRLPLWGLAAGGEQGAVDALDMLRSEIDGTLANLGIADVGACVRLTRLHRCGRTDGAD